MLIHNIDPNDADIKPALLAKVYSALPMDIQVACEAASMDAMIEFLEQMSEKFTSEADIVALLRREVSSSNPQLIWTRYQQLLKTLTPEATPTQIALSAWRACRTQIYANTPFFADIVAQLSPPNPVEMMKLIELWKYRMGRMPHANPNINAVTEQTASSTEIVAAVNHVTPQSTPMNNNNYRASNNDHAGNYNNFQASNVTETQNAPQQTYAGAMMTAPAAVQAQPNTMRSDTNFQHLPANNSTQAPQHNTNAPAGQLVHFGINLCANHKQSGTRCRNCLGGGCEWQQIFDPSAINNSSIRPLKSYGEAMKDRERAQQNLQYQQDGQQQNALQQNPRGNNVYNYQPRWQQQQQYPGVNNVQYYPPPAQVSNDVRNNTAFTTVSGSGNAQGAPSQTTGRQ
jgi:hypothetical protein